MAALDDLIPFLLHFEAGVPKSYLSRPLPDLFDVAKRTGFANDPLDSGGATMCGVTLTTYTIYRRNQGYVTTTVDDLKRITFIAWRAIAKTMFWDKWQADKIGNQALANILVDWVWCSGVNGIKIPQRILGVTPDGIVGVKTLAALNSANSAYLFEKIHEARINFVKDIVERKPNQRKFLNGWKRRINAITYNGFEL